MGLMDHLERILPLEENSIGEVKALTGAVEIQKYKH